MKKDIQNNLTDSQSVKNQLNQLEAQNATNEKNKNGSTNEINPIVTDEGLNQ
ncbi:hypothetical protein [Neobacillus terrae]|uniref:hypothetical protein n=1 Tax=Neobacillus terrae TaxID=3034837 RepID=UPI00140C5EC5|nr:hypothetical protein [Neobacillus terrae]NHM33947.1 hypothetical protein [Neobacillus terrae]